MLPGREAATAEALLHNTPRREERALYQTLGITITYGNATMTATVRSRPSIPYRHEGVSEGRVDR
ncbi:hypothetical protein GCM10010524_27960 [Streptomyces mexicanus]